MNIGPGFVALMKFGHSVPVMYPQNTPVTATITPG
jgi:hypothetical protein